MKTKKWIAASLLTIVSAVVLFYSCSRDDDPVLSQETTLQAEEENSLIYEDPNKLGDPSPYFYDNHFYRIEHIGVNHERSQVENALPDAGCAQIGEMHKYYFDNSKMLMYSIPGNDPEKTWIVYRHEDTFQSFEVDYYPLAEGGMQFRMQTPDGAHFYSLKIDEENYLYDFELSDNRAVTAFSERIYHTRSQKVALKSASAECCRREDSWRDCMTCTLNDCDNSLFCRITGLVIGPYLAAGFAGSCVGAGPDTFC